MWVPIAQHSNSYDSKCFDSNLRAVDKLLAMEDIVSAGEDIEWSD
jgi:hypothetical protein